MADEMKKLLETAIQDACSAETQILEALPKVEKAATHQALTQGCREHRQETERQVQRLQEACKQLGIQPEGATCEAMEGLVEEAEELMEAFKQGPVRDAALNGAAETMGHYEIATYGTITAMPKTMGEQPCADLIAETLAEETKTDERLTQRARRDINPAAPGRKAAKAPGGQSRGAA